MKSKVQFYTASIVAIIGILLLIFSSHIESADVIVTGGILFIIAAVLDIVVSLGEKDKDGKRKAGSFLVIFNWIVSVAAIILGLCMIFIKDAFVPFVPYVFGLISLFGSLMLFYILAIGLRPILLSGWLYLAPVAMLVLSIFIFLRDPGADDKLIMMLTGISALVFALCSYCVGFGLVSHHRAQRLEAEGEAKGKAEAEKVKPVALDDSQKTKKDE